ncbi:helix-turn-helix transcriptional regulator [Burkholderia gladioli]|uniref:helix-turn-helix transcriptional regulator n=1 Tax=Burkholderia gladioli TaxID=28095 RepID=UPI0016405D89|nr:AlpA family phage regulatory protein [Burkholderia gladioli]
MQFKTQIGSLPQPLSAYLSTCAETVDSTRSPETVRRIIRVKELVERIGLSRSTVYMLIATDPSFPKKIKLTERTTGFDSVAVDAWIASRAQARTA